VQDGVVIAEEVDLVDAQGMGSNFLDDVLDDLISASLSDGEGVRWS